MSKENKFNFTEERLRKIKPAATGKRAYYYDQSTAGLRLTVTDRGGKSFQVQTWSPAKQKPIISTIGKWPSVPLHEARSRASRLLVEVRDGIDPLQLKRQRRAEMTIAEVAEIFMQEHAKPNKKSWRDDECRLNKRIIPDFGAKKMSDLSHEDVKRWHSGLVSAGLSRTTANRYLEVLSGLYTVVLPKTENPCDGIKHYREVQRDRFLNQDEVRRLFATLEAEQNEDIRDYILLSLFIGARRANIQAMRWSDIDFNLQQWCIPFHQSKSGSTMLIPLVVEALEVLERRKATTTSAFVFPGKGKTGHLVDLRRPWQRILNHAGIDDFHLHDLRRTLGSWQAITGASLPVIGKSLGHKSTAATSIYARLSKEPVQFSMQTAVSAMKQIAAMPAEETAANVIGNKTTQER
ncbi:tyrosine-type recombinase/integrase [uncultured Desulfobulbus sp.]|uniref:tyrosine-type recombinase/integrase n=1 Tax=uncultured Desulfobulbus sp. TaxID=239745 RepID=UPI0029C74F6C|nr:tyrosine-type recombinase/integrase [uncultured Desulfobulbus sp.]